MNTNEQRAVGLYAVLARDFSDFIDMIQEENKDVLQILLEMLELPNDKHDEHTKELNKLGANIVRRKCLTFDPVFMDMLRSTNPTQPDEWLLKNLDVDAMIAVFFWHKKQVTGQGQWSGIAKIIEESGELLQVLGKLVAFPSGIHPDGDGDLVDRTKSEIADVYASLDYFTTKHELHQDGTIGERRKMKTDRFFNKYSMPGIKDDSGGLT